MNNLFSIFIVRLLMAVYTSAVINFIIWRWCVQRYVMAGGIRFMLNDRKSKLKSHIEFFD